MLEGLGIFNGSLHELYNALHSFSNQPQFLSMRSRTVDAPSNAAHSLGQQSQLSQQPKPRKASSAVPSTKNTGASDSADSALGTGALTAALSEALVSALQIAAHLARSAETEPHFESLARIFTPSVLTWLLSASFPSGVSASFSAGSGNIKDQGGGATYTGRLGTVQQQQQQQQLYFIDSIARAKCCNLVGNLCRFSDRFYGTLASPLPFVVRPAVKTVSVDTVLGLLVKCCMDHDQVTRKFACFSVGNGNSKLQRFSSYLDLL